MRLVTPKMNVEVKYKKVSVNSLVPTPNILMRANGKKVESKRRIVSKVYLWKGKRLASEIKLIDPTDIDQATQKPREIPSYEAKELLEQFIYIFVDEAGVEISKKDVEYFLVQESGQEQRVRPFDRTKEIRIVKEISATNLSSFLIESTYELFHLDDSVIDTLYEEAERYLKEDIVGIATFSWGNGFKQFYALIYPILRDEKFVWLMHLSMTKLEYQHLMTLPALKIPIAQPPTVSTLPPVEELIVA